MNNILYISSEAFPLIKTGGLADVAGSLTVALLKQKQNVRLLLPAYPEVLKSIKHRKTIAQCSYYNLSVDLLETRLPGSNLVVWLVDCPAVFNRPGGPYSDHHGEEWHDNALRFTMLCHAAVDIALDKLSLNWQPDIVHCNDWQSGLVPALLSLHKKRPATIFTVHNLAYQGVFDQQTFDDLELPKQLWHMNGVEFYGQFSFIKAGLAYADKITTVSPTYANEILKAEHGYGMEGLLKYRKKDLTGILNGIDEKYWNPGTDTLIFQKYNKRSVTKKTLNKTALQKELGLPVDSSIPMIGLVGRLVEQKGLDIILESLDTFLDLPLQLVILGTGDTHYEVKLSAQAQKHKQKFKVIIGYSERLAHCIEAASDLYLMPSTFEPCGLNQLYSLRYGTLPIVTRVGGLADTVIDSNKNNQDTANGFVLEKNNAAALIKCVKHALKLYTHTKKWRTLQINAMSYDSSWQASADAYIHLYQQALDTR